MSDTAFIYYHSLRPSSRHFFTFFKFFSFIFPPHMRWAFIVSPVLWACQGPIFLFLPLLPFHFPFFILFSVFLFILSVFNLSYSFFNFIFPAFILSQINSISTLFRSNKKKTASLHAHSNHIIIAADNRRWFNKKTPGQLRNQKKGPVP